jgi:hypothetical protein
MWEKPHQKIKIFTPSFLGCNLGVAVEDCGAPPQSSSDMLFGMYFGGGCRRLRSTTKVF